MADELSERTLGYQLIAQFQAASGQLGAAVADALRELDLTEPSANLLWLLDPDADPPSMKELAGRLYCDPSTITFIIDKLQKRGLVERRPGARDGRVKVVALTETGIAHRRKLIQVVTNRSPMSRLTLRERRQLHRLLEKAVGTA
ncbi:MarR family winged helix-turn-helix transcriptional regulator [Nocardia suismassiliense]|uniref:MarR family winged helix-turn-helix transcriptional regulator n=1 Tax=Nocardia suismassiliense TaxID=2077092 RepID=UPI00131F4315|nr:MarR family transcriptional regulator [Nocardia suismassiliense]